MPFHRVGLYTPYHPIDAQTRNAQLEGGLPIRIGNDVWFGDAACVPNSRHMPFHARYSAAFARHRSRSASSIARMTRAGLPTAHVEPGEHWSDHPDFVDTWPVHGAAGTPNARHARRRRSRG